MKKMFLFIGLIGLLAGGVWYYFSLSNTDIIDNSLLVENYVRKNISELSPEKEVLGGKFYVTNIIFADEDTAVVEYEDGHIALKASFKYKIQDNQVEVYDFVVLSNN